MKHPRPRVRLSTDVVPLHYSLSLTPDLSTFTFEGNEVIRLSVKKPVRSLTLHAKDLEIASAHVTDASGEERAATIVFDDKAETVTFNFKRKLSTGTAELMIIFSGVLNDKMHGFYRSSYEHDGKTKYIATTQFEATDARRAFPCFDEPALKAVFEVSLTVPRESTVISNTIPVSTKKLGDLKTVRFAPTPLMSTYLLAFIVGDFEYVQKRTSDGVLVRVFVTPGKKHQARFALECAAKTVTYFNEYFDIPYPLPVLDLVAIPDFSAGAMENWGAITYRESALLVDPTESSTMNKQWVALVIAHEIAHQWFGNLVTMEWWTHLWLNEGFASYIEYLAVDHIFPEWDIWTHFLVSDFGAALNADGLAHTHPIEIEVHHPSEIAAVFDAVSYSKGASIIRMLAEYLGEEAFRDGLRYYLKKHSYGNTFTVDLWSALSKVSGKPVAKIMSNWTAKSGYPLVTVSEGKQHFNLTQSRFFASPISQKGSRDRTTWQVPISIECDQGARPDPFIMTGHSAQIPKPDSWIKLNVNESGFYRTRYPARLLEMLAEPIASKRLHTRDRLGLIRDVMALAETGTVHTRDGLEFARHFAQETEYVVWSEILSRLAKIYSLFAQEPFAREYEAFALDILSEIKKHITWDTRPKDHSQALLKVLILGNLGRYGDAQTIARARELFDSIRGQENPIQADLRGVVYDIVARHGGPKEHNKLMSMYKQARLSEEKNRIGRALASLKQKDLLSKTLTFALSSAVRHQDSVRIIGAVSVNTSGNDVAWEFITSHWKELFERYAAGRELSYLLSPLEVSSSLVRAKEIGAFIKKHPAPGTERTISQTIEHIRSNAAWRSRDRKGLANFLKNA